MSYPEYTVIKLNNYQKEIIKDPYGRYVNNNLMKRKRLALAKQLGIKTHGEDFKDGIKLIPNTRDYNYINYDYIVIKGDPVDEIGLKPIHIMPRTGLMRPVEPEVRKLLYSTNRYNYLKERNKPAPYDKYYYPYCTSWRYGWKVNERDLEIRCLNYRPEFGITLHDNCMSSTGLDPDPVHYVMPQEEMIHNCPQM